MSTPGQVTRLLDEAATHALSLMVAERRLPTPAAIPAVNAAQFALIQACCSVADAVRAMPPGETPAAWRQKPERKAS